MGASLSSSAASAASSTINAASSTITTASGTITAAAIMTPSRRLLFARPSTSLAQCARLMRAAGCRHLPVVGDEAARGSNADTDADANTDTVAGTDIDANVNTGADTDADATGSSSSGGDGRSVIGASAFLAALMCELSRMNKFMQSSF